MGEKRPVFESLMGETQWDMNTVPAVLLVSRQFSQEAMSILFSTARFCFSDSETLATFIRRTKDSNLIANVELSFSGKRYWPMDAEAVRDAARLLLRMPSIRHLTVNMTMLVPFINPPENSSEDFTSLSGLPRLQLARLSCAFHYSKLYARYLLLFLATLILARFFSTVEYGSGFQSTTKVYMF